MERLEQLQPASAAALAHVHDVAWRAADRDLLALCEARMAALLRGEDAPDGTDARERAYLEFTDQFVTFVGSVSDEQVAALLAHDPPEAVWAFSCALYALELTRRMETVAEAVL